MIEFVVILRNFILPTIRKGGSFRTISAVAIWLVVCLLTRTKLRHLFVCTIIVLLKRICVVVAMCS